MNDQEVRDMAQIAMDRALLRAAIRAILDAIYEAGLTKMIHYNVAEAEKVYRETAQ